MSTYQEVSYLLRELEYWKWLLERDCIKDFIKTAKQTIDKAAKDYGA